MTASARLRVVVRSTRVLAQPIAISLYDALIGAVLVVAFVVRVWNLASVPVSPHADEMAGLVGFSAMVHHLLPPLAFYDLRIVYLPMYGVAEYGATYLFGDTVTALRFPAVLFGLVTVWQVSVLARKLTDDKWIALLAAAVTAILPWSIELSRIGWEPSATLPFLLGGLILTIDGVGANDNKRTLWGFAVLAIGAYTYRAELLYGVLLAAVFLGVNYRNVNWRWALAGGVCIYTLILAPLTISALLDPNFFSRAWRISIFHGDLAESMSVFAHNYIAHFSYRPLFVEGDGSLAHGPHAGVLYAWMLPFLVLGVFTAFRFTWQTGAFLAAWLLLYPLGGALTNDGVPHFYRTLIGAPLFAVLAAIGMVAAWRLWPARLTRWRSPSFVVLFCAAVVAFSLFCKQFFIIYPDTSASAFQYGYRQLFATIRANGRANDTVCLDSYDWYNNQTLWLYYMGNSTLHLSESFCPAHNSIIVLRHPGNAASGTPFATVEDWYGNVAFYLYRND